MTKDSKQEGYLIHSFLLKGFSHVRTFTRFRPNSEVRAFYDDWVKEHMIPSSDVDDSDNFQRDSLEEKPDFYWDASFKVVAVRQPSLRPDSEVVTLSFLRDLKASKGDEWYTANTIRLTGDFIEPSS